MTVPERKRTAELAVAEAAGGGGVMVSCSDQSLDTVVELARHAQAIGADYIVVHTPLLYFGAHTPDTIFEYYRYVAEQVDIGIALWNQPPDCGYLLEPEVCLRLAEIPNVVAISAASREHGSPHGGRPADRQHQTRKSGSTTSSARLESTSARRRRSCRRQPTGGCTSTPSSPSGARSTRHKVRDSLAPVRHALHAPRPPAGRRRIEDCGAPQAAGGPIPATVLKLTNVKRAPNRVQVVQPAAQRTHAIAAQFAGQLQQVRREAFLDP
jgi:4-hydroxy-tetrahydrodipicolinate synthase